MDVLGSSFLISASIACVFALTACGDSGSTSDGGTDTGGESSSSKTPGTTTGPGTGSEGSAASTETNPSGSDSDGNSGGSESGTGGGASGCEAMCQNLVMCIEGYSFEECMQSCDDLAGSDPTPECLATTDVLIDCLAEASCEDLSGGGACAPESQIQESSCSGGGGGECHVSFYEGTGDDCGYFYECPEEFFGIYCDGDVCTCIYNQEMVGMCNYPGICQLPEDGGADYIDQCCNF